MLDIACDQVLFLLVLNKKECLDKHIKSDALVQNQMHFKKDKAMEPHNIVGNAEMENLREQVMFNCHVSDGRYGGVFSLCGFLLRMRDFYKWEQGLNPWDDPDYPDLLQWVENKEKMWEKTAMEEFRPLALDDRSLDPFDVDEVNAGIMPSGLFYGAGYATGMKPTFFLASTSTFKTINNMHIHILDKELARDLFTSPAIRQGNHIIIRPWTMAALLWDLILEKKPSTLEALKYALAQFDLDLDNLRRFPEKLGNGLWQVAREESETLVYHEMGEALQEEFDLGIWQELVAYHANTIVEKTARAVKDLLADTHEQGLLAHIIEQKKKSSLGLYLCFATPISKVFFPEIAQGFEWIKRGNDWNVLEEIRQKGYLKGKKLAGKLMHYHLEGQSRGNDWVRSRVETELIEPMGVNIEEDE